MEPVLSVKLDIDKKHLRAQLGDISRDFDKMFKGIKTGDVLDFNWKSGKRELSDLKKSVKGVEDVFESTSDDIKRAKRNLDYFGDDGAKRMDKFAKETTGKLKDTANKAGSLIQGIGNKLFSPLGLSGIGIGTLIHQAHDMNKMIWSWHDGLRALSDASGSTNKAFGMIMNTWGKTGATMGTITANLSALNANGLSPMRKETQQLLPFITQLSLATGIAADSFAGFAGEMVQAWQIPTQEIGNMVSQVIALGDSFGMTSHQMEMVMNVSKSVIGKLGALFKNAAKDAEAMNKGIAMSIGTLNKMGVSAQVASDFIGKLFDPEQMSQNQALFARLGISFQEQMELMENPGNKEMFFDKLMNNLPKLSKQIESLKNPMARLQFSKSLGLPLEIAQKMARATGTEIQNLMEEYKEKAKGDEAARKKQENMKAESAKFDEKLMFLKMNALMPLMDWVNRNYGVFFKILNFLSGLFNKFASKLTNVFDIIGEKMLPSLSKAGDIDFGTILGDLIKGAAPALIAVFKEVIGSLFSAMPMWLKMVAGGLGIFQVTKVLGTVSMALNALTGKQGLGASLGAIGGGLKRIPGIGKIAGKAGGIIGGIGGAVGGLLGIGGGDEDGGVADIASNVGGKVKGGGKGLKGLLKGGKGLLKGAGKIALPLMAVSALIDAVGGWGSAGETFGKGKGEEATTGQKTAGALGSAISGFTFGLLDADKISRKLYGSFNDLDEKGKAELKTIENKITFGQKLTAKEEERYRILDQQKTGYSDVAKTIGEIVTSGGLLSYTFKKLTTSGTELDKRDQLRYDFLKSKKGPLTAIEEGEKAKLEYKQKEGGLGGKEGGLKVAQFGEGYLKGGIFGALLNSLPPVQASVNAFSHEIIDSEQQREFETLRTKKMAGKAEEKDLKRLEELRLQYYLAKQGGYTSEEKMELKGINDKIKRAEAGDKTITADQLKNLKIRRDMINKAADKENITMTEKLSGFLGKGIASIFGGSAELWGIIIKEKMKNFGAMMGGIWDDIIYAFKNAFSGLIETFSLLKEGKFREALKSMTEGIGKRAEKEQTLENLIKKAFISQETKTKEGKTIENYQAGLESLRAASKSGNYTGTQNTYILDKIRTLEQYQKNRDIAQQEKDRIDKANEEGKKATEEENRAQALALQKKANQFGGITAGATASMNEKMEKKGAKKSAQFWDIFTNNTMPFSITLGR